MSLGMSVASCRMDSSASPTPSAQPMLASSMPSVMNCRTSRRGDAPSAPRTAISRLRVSDRTSSRLATFTLAISSSNAAPHNSTSSIGRMSPTITSVSGIRNAAWSRFESGYCFSSCLAIASMSSIAASNVTPSLSRAMPTQAVAAAANSRAFEFPRNPRAPRARSESHAAVPR